MADSLRPDRTARARLDSRRPGTLNLGPMLARDHRGVRHPLKLDHA
ncbi:MAG: hypothetical protein KA191_11920 [Verrucomicrobia bacterium]|nr:hypothetical protein [Verrucomicrobiota bacterium]MDI9380444.1 hypothetical protein [Verrucomicrobiota bacterium]NMD18918.1 hypothetical protein [Verrucomicrobiota bacterium]HNU99533.1 hypothetical protein [Verrucomicrobiota bacterium]HOA62231.1 hypothetical protein [Verrucomicrobiota bacterium]